LQRTIINHQSSAKVLPSGAGEVEHLFPEIGRRTTLLNAWQVFYEFYEGNSHTTILLGIEDVTARRALERDREELLRRQESLVREKDVLLGKWSTGSAIACRSLRRP
jgi:hypothetical protein